MKLVSDINGQSLIISVIIKDAKSRINGITGSVDGEKTLKRTSIFTLISI